MYLNAESVKVDNDEGSFTLEIESTEEDRITVNIHNIDLDAFYDQVKARIGPYLREMHEARQAVASGVTLAQFTGAPEDEDESGPYDISSTKHPRYHSTHADIHDQREKEGQ